MSSYVEGEQVSSWGLGGRKGGGRRCLCLFSRMRRTFACSGRRDSAAMTRRVLIMEAIPEAAIGWFEDCLAPQATTPRLPRWIGGPGRTGTSFLRHIGTQDAKFRRGQSGSYRPPAERTIIGWRTQVCIRASFSFLCRPSQHFFARSNTSCMCVCVCVCVRARERERDKERERGKEREREILKD